jgi:RNA polymerase sigma-70 factor (ECF subfamily)
LPKPPVPWLSGEASIREAAEVLGATPGAVKLRAHRAYVALRSALGDVVDRS